MKYGAKKIRVYQNPHNEQISLSRASSNTGLPLCLNKWDSFVGAKKLGFTRVEIEGEKVLMSVSWNIKLK